MKRLGLTLSIVLMALIVIGGVHFVRARIANNQREAAYQSALQAYSQVLQPGMSRQAVEDYLHSRNFHFKKCSQSMVSIGSMPTSLRLGKIVPLGTATKPISMSRLNLMATPAIQGQ